MPALPAVNSVAKVLLKYVATGVTDALTRMFFTWAGSLSDTSLNNWCSTVATQWANNIKPLVGTDASLVEVTAEDLTTATGPVGIWSGTDTGTAAGVTPAAGVALVIQDVIARRYRGGHPRKYLPFLYWTSADLTGANEWTTTFANGVLSDWETFLGAISGANGPSGTTAFAETNVSYYSGFTSVQNPITHRYRNVPTLRATPATDVVVGHNVNYKLASQRRRNQQGS